MGAPAHLTPNSQPTPVADAIQTGLTALLKSPWLKTLGKELWQWLKLFRSIHLAITLLSLLAIGVMVGVFMPQEGLVEAAKIKAQFGQQYYLYKAMGLFNVYGSPWFLALEVLFFFNLLFGSFQWLRPAYLAATRREFCAPEHMTVSPNHFKLETRLPLSTVETLLKQSLKEKRYHLFQKEDSTKMQDLKQFYASKGNFSRLGPAVAHLGILLLLIFSLYGAFTGYKANQLLVPGQSFNFPKFDEFHPNMPEGWWQGSVPDWQFRLHDFRVVYYPQDPATPQQYYSDLAIHDASGKLLKRETLSVNHPLQLGDTMVYQANFAPTGKLNMVIDGKPQKIEVNTQFQNRPVSMISIGKPSDQRSLIVFPFFVKQDPNILQNQVRVFLHQGQGFMGAVPGKMPENLQLFEGESGRIGNHTIQFIQPELATGFLIKKAPETPWIYLSFAIIMLGTVMCVFSQRQIWLAVESSSESTLAEENPTVRVYAHFKTNKAKLSFARELDAWRQGLITSLQVSPLPGAV